jgi:FkbM family methyltransferase
MSVTQRAGTMNVSQRARTPFSRIGLNRSLVARRVVRLGSRRLYRLQHRADAGGDPAALLLRYALRWLQGGLLRVPQGHANGLVFDMRYLPIAHAHLGSIASGNLESAVQEAMIRHLGPGDVFFDIGANLGFFSMLGAHLVGFGKGRVYAFEAAPENAEAVARNAGLNLIPNITVIAKAVSSQSGTGRLQVVEDQSWSKLEDYGEHPDTEQVIEVELVSIDELLAAGALPPPTLVKIDVEGAELAVLRGMAHTLERHQPAVICELHGTHREFVELMASHRYRLINLEGTIPVQEEGASAHALALPPGNEGD